MQITVTGRHFEITEPLRQHIENKMSKLSRYIEGITDVQVVLSVEKHRHLAEITLQANGTPIRGLEEKHDMYLAVDKYLIVCPKDPQGFIQIESGIRSRLDPDCSQFISIINSFLDRSVIPIPVLIHDYRAASVFA